MMDKKCILYLTLKLPLFERFSCQHSLINYLFAQPGGHRPGGPHPGGGLKSPLNLEAIQQPLDPLLEFKWIHHLSLGLFAFIDFYVLVLPVLNLRVS